MTKDERIKKAIELLKEAIECLDESGGYAPVVEEETLIEKINRGAKE